MISTAPRACVIGHPVAHSRSPLIHGHWLRSFGLEGSYQRENVAPDALGDFLRSLGSRGYVGANVTVPHKEAAAALCAVLTPRAARMGSVNTLWLEDGVLHGDSTDGEGFCAHFDATYPGAWADARVTILGAGGAARSLAFRLGEEPLRAFVLVNRSLPRAEALRDELLRAQPAAPAAVADWEDLPAVLAATDVLINATSLGMQGKPPLDLDLAPLPAHAIVCDLVYVPLQTGLLRQAAGRGLRTLDGLGMLLHQAVPGFERWFGRRPQVDAELRALLLADLGERG